MMRSCAALLPHILASTLMAAVPVSAMAEEYRLGPQDELQIKVFDLRQGTGEAFQWKAFDGTFAVAANGHLSIPLAGDFVVEGRTVDEVAKDVATRLQKRVGLTALPDASVQIVKYRPIFIMGIVDKPGSYPYQPNLTVLEAVGLAGGLDRVNGDALLGYERDALNTRGELRVLMEEHLALRIREARLDAEIAGANVITLLDDVRSKSNDPPVAGLIKEEQLLFEARRYTIQSETASLEQSKVFLQQELSSLAQKDTSLDHQLDTTNKELVAITGLVSRGLTVLPRQLELEQSTAQLQSNKLDVSVAMVRAKQDIAKADRDILELSNSRRSDSLQEATQVHNRLAELQHRIDTAQKLITHVEVRAPAALSMQLAGEHSPIYRITRRVDGAVKTFEAGEADAVQPGDVVRVVPDATSVDEAAMADGANVRAFGSRPAVSTR